MYIQQCQSRANYSLRLFLILRGEYICHYFANRLHVKLSNILIYVMYFRFQEVAEVNSTISMSRVGLDRLHSYWRTMLYEFSVTTKILNTLLWLICIALKVVVLFGQSALSPLPISFDVGKTIGVSSNDLPYVVVAVVITLYTIRYILNKLSEPNQQRISAKGLYWNELILLYILLMVNYFTHIPLLIGIYDAHKRTLERSIISDLSIWMLNKNILAIISAIVNYLMIDSYLFIFTSATENNY